MRELNGYVIVPREIINWKWYKNQNTFRVFFHLFILANFQDADFENETIHRGEIATSYQKIADAIGITLKQARTAIDHLKRAGDVATRRGRQFLVITILHYDELQDTRAGTRAAKRAVKGQSEGSQRAVKRQQMNNDKNDKKNKNEKKRVCTPTQSEIDDYAREFGLQIDTARFFNHYESIGWKKNNQPIVDWKALVRKWSAEDAQKASTDSDDIERDDFGRPIKEDY